MRLKSITGPARSPPDPSFSQPCISVVRQEKKVRSRLNRPTSLIPIPLATHPDYVFVRGAAYSFSAMQSFLLGGGRNIVMPEDFKARDISALFYDTSEPCRGYGLNLTSTQCSVASPWNNGYLVAKPCVSLATLISTGPRPRGKLSFLWGDLTDKRREAANLVIYDGNSKL